MLAFAVLLLATANALPSSRIINGEAAKEHEFPWQVSLQSTSGSHFCGGSVIDTTWVVTAAHCVDGAHPSVLKVVVREHNLGTDGGQEEEYEVVSIIMHERYGMGQGFSANDVALLKLSRQVNPDYIIPRATSGDFSGETCTISGWGVTEEGSLSDLLQKVEVEVLTDKECKQKMESLRSSVNADVHICVFGRQDGGAGACNGDSGGPLVCNGKLAGVTSWGIRGCHADGVVSYPSVYARLTTYDQWFKANMQ